MTVKKNCVKCKAEIAAGDLLIREAGGKIEMMADLVATNGKLEI